MDTKNYWLKEFTLFDGEYNTTFNILNVNTDNMTITLAVTNAGKIFITECDLKFNKENELYFEFGVDYIKIKVDDFETIED